MTRKQIAFVCAVEGVTVVVVNTLIDAIGADIYNCTRDPYFPDWCRAPDIAYLSSFVACWLVATYLLARRDAISPFACGFMGLMLWAGLLGWNVLQTLGIESPQDRDFYLGGLWAAALAGVVLVPVFALLTAAFGYPMQAFTRARHRSRVSA